MLCNNISSSPATDCGGDPSIQTAALRDELLDEVKSVAQRITERCRRLSEAETKVDTPALPSDQTR